NGSNGGTGGFGSNGINGSNGFADGVITTGAAPSGFAARVHNNIFSFVGVGTRRAVLSLDAGIIDITTNAFSGFSTLALGPNIGNLTVNTRAPMFVDPSNGDFTPVAGTFLVDGGDNAFVPAAITTDFLGNPRFADELSTPDTGSGDDFIVDYGAIEAEGDSAETCPADLAAPFGVLDVFDVLAYLALFDDADPAADLAAPIGTFDVFDVLAYLAQFDAGCL
ncbi:MAG: GC-type dockerin domain-anchored protein, partial [Planctomycetota bacterium]